MEVQVGFACSQKLFLEFPDPKCPICFVMKFMWCKFNYFLLFSHLGKYSDCFSHLVWFVIRLICHYLLWKNIWLEPSPYLTNLTTFTIIASNSLKHLILLIFSPFVCHCSMPICSFQIEQFFFFFFKSIGLYSSASFPIIAQSWHLFNPFQRYGERSHTDAWSSKEKYHIRNLRC